MAFTVEAVSVDRTVIVFAVNVFPERVDVFTFVKIIVDAVIFCPLATFATILLPTIVENMMFPLIVEPVIVEIVIVLP